MATQSSYKPSDMVKSMNIDISTFTQHFSQTEINNLALGNNEIRLTNPAIINHVRHSNISSLTPSIRFTPKYTQITQQSSGEGVSLPSQYNLSSTNFCIGLGSPGSSSPSGFILPQNAYLFSCESGTIGLAAIVNQILDVFTGNPVTLALSGITDWIPNFWGSGSSYWYNCAGVGNNPPQDYISQQIILYAALYSYIEIVLNNNVPNFIVIPLQPNIAEITNVGTMSFLTTWPFLLNTLNIEVSNSTLDYPRDKTYQTQYSSTGSAIFLPQNQTTLDENDLATYLTINNLPITITTNSNTVYTSNISGDVFYLQPASTAVSISFAPAVFYSLYTDDNSQPTTVTITINNVILTLNISVPPNWFSLYGVI